jgi:hypothetical protein
MSIYEILPAPVLTQSVHAKISIGMHRVVKFKISRIPLIAVPRITEIPKFYRNPRIFTEIPLDITEIPIRSSEIPLRWKDKTLF